ncbi:MULTISPECIES: hypothetical protein [Actinomadura]|uniref:hypothetical protein n=1 Tax=Actinomadura TaxID=1988 RepID=UPI0004253718|nr:MULTISPECIES: hypothetical protein [Actinomadura]RSN57994.1 hypothetical protein DMH08_23580 [Actinomadura sp. WAC 06369]
MTRDHGAVLAADARTMAECADRLRALAARLRTHDAAPDWLFTALHEHITACVVASEELAEAAARLRALADGPRPPRGRR